MRKHLLVASFLILLPVCLLKANAQSQAGPAIPKAWAWVPITTPDQSQAIKLGTVDASTPDTEQWVTSQGHRSVYNVSVPTVQPYLPDPAKRTGAAIIIAPGGGFLYLAYDSEGHDVARWFADHGITVFLLKYRTKPVSRDPQVAQQAVFELVKRVAAGDNSDIETPTATLEDAKAAVRLVRSRAKDWGIDPARVGFMGFSAGAITTVSVGLVDDKASRPDFIGAIYGAINVIDVPKDAPPLFLALAANDGLFGLQRIFALIDSWRHAGRPVEAHIYVSGGHGFGMGVNASTALWPDEFYAWMTDIHLLKPSHP